MNKLANQILCATAAAAALLLSPMASAELSANAGVTSNYVWRGATQTDDGAALQGGVDYAHDSGVYVGAWASNVEEGLEYDLYAGFSNEVAGFGYDIGYLTYNYTDDDFADNSREIKLGVSYGPATLNHYWGDDGAGNDKYTYTELNLEFELPAEVALALHYGAVDPDFAGADSLYDYSVGVSKEFAGIKAGVSYADQEGGDDPVAFITLSKNFGL